MGAGVHMQAGDASFGLDVIHTFISETGRCVSDQGNSSQCAELSASRRLWSLD